MKDKSTFNDEILKRLREVEVQTQDPMVYAIIQLIEAGRDPEKALLEGFLRTAECLRQMTESWKKHLESQPIHGLTVMLEGPSEEKRKEGLARVQEAIDRR